MELNLGQKEKKKHFSFARGKSRLPLLLCLTSYTWECMGIWWDIPCYLTKYAKQLSAIGWSVTSPTFQSHTVRHPIRSPNPVSLRRMSQRWPTRSMHSVYDVGTTTMGASIIGKVCWFPSRFHFIFYAFISTLLVFECSKYGPFLESLCPTRFHWF